MANTILVFWVAAVFRAGWFSLSPSAGYLSNKPGAAFGLVAFRYGYRPFSLSGNAMQYFGPV